MALYLGTDDSGTTASGSSLQDFAPTAGQKFKAAYREAWLESLGPVAAAVFQSRISNDEGRRLSSKEVEDAAKAAGVKLRGTSLVDGVFTQKQADVLISRQRELAAIKDVRERTPWEMGSVLRGGAMFGAGIVDPVNLATAFVPWTRSVTALRGVAATAETGATFAARTGARAALGAADAGISTALLEVPYAIARRELGDDYTAMDSLANIAFGTAFGGGVHTIAGGVSDVFRGRFSRATPAPVDPVTPGAVPEVRVTPEAERVGMPELKGEPEARIEFVPEKVQQAVEADVAARSVDAPAQAPARAALTGVPLVKRRGMDSVDVDATLANLPEVPDGYVRLYRADSPTTKFDDVFDRDQLQDFASSLPGTRFTDDLKYADYFRSSYGNDATLRYVDVPQQVAEAGRINGYEFKVDLDNIAPPRQRTAAEVAVSLAPETREAALRAAVAQAVDGRPVDVDALIGLDDSLQTHTIDDVAAAVDRGFEPESQPLADFEVSRAVDDRNATAPKWDLLEAADQALIEADALLADTVRAGDEAWRYSRQRQTDTEAFKKWFGDSRVVGADGEPLVVYHGTDQSFDSFAREKLGAATGAKSAAQGFFFVSRSDVAASYANYAAMDAPVRRAMAEADKAEKRGNWDAYDEAVQRAEDLESQIGQAPQRGQNTIPVFLSIKNPAEMDAGGELFTSIQDKINAFILRAKREGRDGVIIRNLDDDPRFSDRVGDHYMAFDAKQIKSATGNRGTFDPNDPSILYSRGITGQSAVDELTTAVRTSFGAATDALMQAGRVKVVAKVTDIPDGPHPGDVKGATAPDGTVYIVAENVSPAEARGMVLHEVGVHVGMEAMVGPDVFRALKAEFDDALVAGAKWARDARNAVPSDTPAWLVHEEQLAYLVQNAPELPIVQRIIAAVRAWAFRTFALARENMTLTEADFLAMAVAALHHAASERGMAGSGGTSFGRFGRGERASSSRFSDDNRLSNLSPNGPSWQRIRENNPALRGKAPDDEITVYRATIGDSIRNDDFVAVDRSTLDAELENVRDRDGSAAKIVSMKVKVRDLLMGNDATEFVYFKDQAEAPTRYSRGETPDPSTAQSELAPFDEAVARAKQYANVLRAAADKLANDADATAAMRAAMPDITKAEIDDLLGQLRKQVKGLRGVARSAREAVTADDRATAMQSDAMKAADTLANNLQLAAVIERRNAALNQNVRLKASAFLNQFRKPGLDFEGFRALLVGSERKRGGARLSVEAEQKQFRGEWLGGMIADMEKAGHWQAFESGAFDRDIYVALHAMGRGETPAGIAPEAVQMAKIVDKYQTDARNTRNRFGAWIRDLSGYITRQTHDMFKIRNVSQSQWVAEVLPMLDLPKMQRLGLISEVNPAQSLAEIYSDFAAGQHLKAVAGEDDVAAFGVGRNLARRESASRVLYFKDGDAAFQYNTKFGQGRLAETVMQGLDGAARSAGLLKNLGTNPQATVERLFDDYALSLKGDADRYAKFMEHRGELKNLLATIDGTSNIPGNVMAAKIAAFSRSWMAMAKLGGMLISAVTDLSNYAAEMRFGQDRSLLGGVLDGMGSLTRGRAKGEQKQILAQLGVFHESVLGGAYHRFDNPDLMGGKTAAAMQTFFKFTGINWWTETLRDSYALSHSHYMAQNAGAAWDALPAALRDMLGLYRIDAGKWEILRLAPMQAADGRAYMTPESLNTIPRGRLEAYIQQAGRTVSDASVQNLRDDLSSALRAMTIDRMHHAVPEAGARTRAFMQRGTQPGTVPGEFLRYIGQFKSFPVALIQMTLGREVYGRGYDTIGEYIRNGKGEMLGLASFIALSTAMGYAAMSAKDLIKGRNPRPVNDPRTWMAAFVQGGGLGIYGDFLFGQYSRTGGGLTSSLAGPFFGALDTLADLKTRLQKGDDVAAASFKAVLDNTPFMNVFYTRAVLDYLFLYNVQEALNPGFLRRMEQRAQRENGQTYWLPPSEAVR